MNNKEKNDYSVAPMTARSAATTGSCRITNNRAIVQDAPGTLRRSFSISAISFNISQLRAKKHFSFFVDILIHI